MKDTNALINDFLANGGTITQVKPRKDKPLLPNRKGSVWAQSRIGVKLAETKHREEDAYLEQNFGV